MRIIRPYTEILDDLDGDAILRKIELCGRVCYKSEDRITQDSARVFVKRILDSGHESVLEHCSFSVRFVCDRGVSHEIVRHRLASYSQESTRYCNYGNEDDGCMFVQPPFFPNGPRYHYDGEYTRYGAWFHACEYADKVYKILIHSGATPQEARSVLPNSLKTEIIMTANLREWRHFFKLRTAAAAHPQMRELTVPLLEELQKLIPVVFDDIQGVPI